MSGKFIASPIPIMTIERGSEEACPMACEERKRMYEQ